MTAPTTTPDTTTIDEPDIPCETTYGDENEHCPNPAAWILHPKCCLTPTFICEPCATRFATQHSPALCTDCGYLWLDATRAIHNLERI